ncbi:ROK family protein [Pedobacter sp. UYEF25]
MNKSIPLVTRLLSQLLERGFLVEKGYAPSSGGRKPLLYGIAPDQLYIVAVAMDQLSTRIVIVDILNNYLTEVETIDLKLRNNPKSLEELINAISNHILNSGITKHAILGVGIGMPGFVNTDKGLNYTYVESGSENITTRVSKALDLPVFIDNDSSLVAFAELKFGAARQIKDVMVINLSWGIGLGMIINGQLFRGHNGFAGEFSHIPISEEGVLCSCGKQGCLEAQASLLAVAEKAIEGIKNGRKTRLIHNENEPKAAVGDALMVVANEGDQFAIELLSEAAYEIGRGLSILIHIINPKAIVLSGRGAKVGKLMLAPIQQALNKYCIPRLAEDTEIYISELGLDAELIGAAILVMEKSSEIEETAAAIL